MKILEVAYENYKDRIPEKDFNELLKLDPTSDKKYMKWLINQLLKARKGAFADYFKLYNYRKILQNI